MTIHDLFEEIKASGLEHHYRVAPVPDISDAYIGSDGEGKPCIFIKCIGETRTPSLQTARLSLDISREFTLFMPDGTQRADRYNTIFCLSNSPDDIETFLTVIGSFLEQSVNERIITGEVTAFFSALLRLFSIKPDENTETRRQGLWGELYFMRQNGGYEFWAPYWHTETSRLFDFSLGKKRIEIKTTIGPNRIHNVSHKQVFSASGEEIYIASMLLAGDDSGVSLRSLITECRDALRETPHYMKLEKAIRHAGMYSQDEGPKYNDQDAAISLRFFDVVTVPRFTASEPDGVSGTHYRIDLTSTPTIDSERLVTWIHSWSTG